MLAHLDDLAGRLGPRAVMAGGEGLHHRRRPHDHQMQIGIGRKGPRRAGEHHIGAEVPAHGVDGDSYWFSHENYSLPVRRCFRPYPRHTRTRSETRCL